MAAAQVARLQDVTGSRSSLSLASTGMKSNTATATSRPANAVQPDLGDKPVASAAGVSCSITLAEPYVYLSGFDLASHAPISQNSTAMIRGKLVLNVTKSAKIKAVTLSFCGKARTEWPEGKGRKTESIRISDTNDSQGYPRKKPDSSKKRDLDIRFCHFITHYILTLMRATVLNVYTTCVMRGLLRPIRICQWWE